MEYKKRGSANGVISSAKKKKQKDASDLNDPEHQNEIF